MATKFWQRNSSGKAQKTIAAVAQRAGLDPRAVNILFNAYGDLDGREFNWVWSEDHGLSAADFQYAKTHGVMHDPMLLDHDGVIALLIKNRDALERHRVADAFIVSLRSRRLEIRSALASYAIFLHIRPHKRIDNASDCKTCLHSSLESGKPREINPNESAFARLMWGGSVHHVYPVYAAFDLGAFAKSSFPTVEEDDRNLLRALLDAIRNLKSTAQLSDLQKSIAGLLPSNKLERQILLETLGYCGILQPKKMPSYRNQFVPESDQDSPSNFWKKEWQWPVQHWTGRDGVNYDAVNFWFPGLED